MKTLLFGTVFLGLILVSPLSAEAGVDVRIDIPIPLPPAIVFTAPPALIMIPETNVYVTPDVPEDVFFYNGWWWRRWDRRWYRSHSYKSGWVHYGGAPSFYSRVPANWRDDYRAHRWKGHHWDYRRIPHHEFQNNHREDRRGAAHRENRGYEMPDSRSQPHHREFHQSQEGGWRRFPT